MPYNKWRGSVPQWQLDIYMERFYREPRQVEPEGWGPDCAQCDQPKDEDNTDPMCQPCTEQHWLDSHGHPFPKRGNQ